MIRADNRLMKKMNQKTLREALSKRQAATKPELAAMTGLSVVTTNALIADLVRTGEVLENGLIPSEGGRPSMQYRYNNDFLHAAIVYCYQKNGRKFARCIVCDLCGENIWESECYFAEVEIESFEKMLDKAFGEVPKIGRIVFGLPGEAIDGVVTINDYPKLIGREFLSHYEKRYGVPILFENDINAMTYGYYCTNHRQVEDIMVGIYFPKQYMPGAGIVLNQKIYYGTQHFAGEMEKFPVPIPWDELDYENEGEVTKELKSILAIFCCTFAPVKIILYGDFFTPSVMQNLRESVKIFLNHSFSVELEVSNTIEKDYETGLIQLALEPLRRQIETWDAE